jgi:hypothetical protein
MLVKFVETAKPLLKHQKICKLHDCVRCIGMTPASGKLASGTVIF